MINPAQSSLDGTIIVLAEARSGSSLLMQTLHRLGRPVIGSPDRPDLPAAANPRGYYEDPDLLAHGLHAPILAAQPEILRGAVVKIGLNRLVTRAVQSAREWETLVQSPAHLLLPVRDPVECLLSREVFAGDRARTTDPIPTGLAGVRSLLRNYGFLAGYFAAHREARPPVCIDYALAVRDPDRYVEQVARSAGLTPAPEQCRAAAANISLDLYRYRATAMPATLHASVFSVHLEESYRILRSGAADTWTRLRQALPAWAVVTPPAPPAPPGPAAAAGPS